MFKAYSQLGLITGGLNMVGKIIFPLLCAKVSGVGSIPTQKDSEFLFTSLGLFFYIIAKAFV